MTINEKTATNTLVGASAGQPSEPNSIIAQNVEICNSDGDFYKK